MTLLVCASVLAAAQTSVGPVNIGPVNIGPVNIGPVNIGPVNIGGNSTATVTLTLPNGGAISSIGVVTQGAPGLDFTDAGGGTCSTAMSYTAGATCTVNVNFAPRFSGARYGAVVLSSSSGPAATEYLNGTGLGPQTAFLDTFTVPTPNVPATLTGLPQGIAVDGSGNIYLGDSGSATGAARVLKETLSAGQYTQSVVAAGLYLPQNISVDGAGNLYILDVNSLINVGATLYKETASNGGYVQSVIQTGITGLPNATADGDGNVYFTDGQTLTSGMLQPDGTYTYSTLPLPVSTSASYPYRIYGDIDGISGDVVGALAVDSAGDVFFTTYLNEDDQSTHAVPTTYLDIIEEKLSAGVYSVVDLGGDGIFYGTGVRTNALPPFNIALDAAGNIYIWEPGYTTGSDLPAPGLGEYTLANGQLLPAQAGFPIPAIVVPNGIAFASDGTVYVTDNRSVATTGGTSVAGVYQLKYGQPPTVNFAATALGATGGLQTTGNPAEVQIANIGNSPLAFSQVSYPSDFPFATGETYISTADLCAAGTPVAGQAGCWLVIEFNPVAPLGGNSSQVLTESVDLTTNTLNASATTQTITVAGTEIAALSPAAAPVFAPAPGTYTSAQSVTITDATPNATIYYTTDGKTTPTTASAVYAGPISVSATETIQAIAVASGFSSSAVASAAYTLPPDFSIAASPAAFTVAAGQSGTATLTVTPVNGFNAAVTFTCSGLPSGASCSFAPATVTPSGAAASTTVTVATSAASAALLRRFNPFFSGSSLALAICCFGWRKRRLPMLLGLAAAVVGLSLVSGCGGSGSSQVGVPIQPVTSTITVTAASGSLSHSASVSLTVN